MTTAPDGSCKSGVNAGRRRSEKLGVAPDWTVSRQWVEELADVKRGFGSRGKEREGISLDATLDALGATLTAEVGELSVRMLRESRATMRCM